MNMAVEWIAYLRERGHEAAHWSGIGSYDADDTEIMAYGAEHGAVILSNDLDFGRLHAMAGTRKPSVVQIRAPDLRPASIGHYVARAFTLTADSLDRGAVVTVMPPRVRVTTLPIGMTDSF